MNTVQHAIALAPYTTFEIGGNAKHLVEVSAESGVQEALAWAREHNLPFFVLGGGSNVLIPDEGLPGLVIKITSEHFSIADTSLFAAAGCTLLALIRATAQGGIGGWEKLAGIPGTLGGALRGNAGAFGPEIKDFVTWVRALNTRTGDVHEFSRAECAFDYRESFFKKNPEWIILDAHLNLRGVASQVAYEAQIEETIRERERRHIQNVKAAGSFFMNPVAPKHLVEEFEREKNTTSRGGRVPAGWLIEKAGMKGCAIGGAQVSLQQANYLINTGVASAHDVRQLAAKVKEAVHTQFLVELREEAVVF